MEGKHEDQPRGGFLFLSLIYILFQDFFSLFSPHIQGWTFQEVETGAGKVKEAAEIEARRL